MNYLTVEPRAFLSTRRNVAISWSPKAGCSHVLVWFLLQENLLHAANQFHWGPHRFRARVYEQSQARAGRVRQLLSDGPEGWTLIKVTRDPLKRMIASFRHTVQYSLIDEIVAKRLGIDVKREGLSLRDYTTALSGLPLKFNGDVDMHVCKQEQPIWHQPFGKIITINMDECDLNAALNAAARETGLKEIDFDQVEKFKWLRREHYAEDVDFNQADVVDFRFKRGEWKGKFPKTSLQRAPEAAQFARILYNSDFDQVRTQA